MPEKVLYGNIILTEYNCHSLPLWILWHRLLRLCNLLTIIISFTAMSNPRIFYLMRMIACCSVILGFRCSLHTRNNSVYKIERVLHVIWLLSSYAANPALLAISMHSLSWSMSGFADLPPFLARCWKFHISICILIHYHYVLCVQNFLSGLSKLFSEPWRKSHKIAS